MNCLVLDDEPLALQLLKTYIHQSPELAPQGFFSNPDEAKARIAAGDIALLFLDIQMPDITGLQVLKSFPNPPMVIFTTAFAEYAVEGFALNAVDYLLKPFDFKRFKQAIEKAVEYYKFLQTQQSPTALFVRVEYSIVQIPFESIRFIEGLDDYIKIHVAGSNRPILTLLPLKKVLEQLPTDRFVRVHRSYIVAKNKIESIRAQKIRIGDREIPISDTYAANLKVTLGTAKSLI